jgi:hypothetical protein
VENLALFFGVISAFAEFSTVSTAPTTTTIIYLYILFIFNAKLADYIKNKEL